MIAEMPVLQVHTATTDEEIQAIIDDPIAIQLFEAVQDQLEAERQRWFTRLDNLETNSPAPLVC